MEAKIWNYQTWILETEPLALMKRYTRLLKESGFTILQICTQTYEPHGFTAVWILAESHLAIHTFPEHGKTYVELSSCNFEKFQNFKEG